MSNWSALQSMVSKSCFATFGVPVIYTPADSRTNISGDQVSLNGIFDERREDVLFLDRGTAGIDGSAPRIMLEITVSELGFVPMEGDEVSVNGTTYRVNDVKLTSGGNAELFIFPV